MTIAVCGTCNVEMIPLPLGTHSDKARDFQCPQCGRIVRWYHDNGESGETYDKEM